MKAKELNIQDEVSKIHHKYGLSEMANYNIQLICESYATHKLASVKAMIKERIDELMEMNRKSFGISYVNESKIKELNKLLTKFKGDEKVL